MIKKSVYLASCSTCIFVGNCMCQKGLDSHFRFPKTWDLKKTVCLSHKTDTFMVDEKYVSIIHKFSSSTYYSLSKKAKKERHKLWFKNLFRLKL